MTTPPPPRSPSRRRERDFRGPVLRFTPYAWAKLIYFRDRGPTEIGGFGVSAADDPLLVQDFVTVRQSVSAVTVDFDDQAVADYFDAQVDAGRRPDRFARIWLHSHPGDSAHPSCVDEQTFERVFGRCDWALMFIVAKGGETYARLRFGVGPGGQIEVPVEVDYAAAFGASDHDTWAQEYDANVSIQRRRHSRPARRGPSDPPVFDGLDADAITIEMYEAMEALGDPRDPRNPPNPWEPGDPMSAFDLDIDTEMTGEWDPEAFDRWLNEGDAA